jgi:hypothetical protein
MCKNPNKMKTITNPKPTAQNDLPVKFFLIAGIILLPLVMSAQNLITNSSFSNGSTGWSGSCSVVVNPETVYGGSNASNYVTLVDGANCLDQDICVLPGFTYTLTLKATRRIDATSNSTASIAIKARGVNSNSNYVNQAKGYSNTSFNWTTQSFTFTVPANSSDKKINLHITDNNNSSSLGVILDDIELHPQTDMAISGATTTVINNTTDYSVSNSPAAGISYNWSFGSGSTPATSTLANPTTKWSTAGTKNMSVAISNGSCLVATLSASVLVTGSLPVNFTSFTGIIKDNKTALSWSTVNEVNNSHFVVERSANGRHYDSVGRVQAGSSTSNTYSFNENNTNATSYYRLKQVDINGAYLYSSVITLKNSGSNKEMTVYPTQATSTINYVVSSETPAAVTVQVYTITGQPVISQQAVLVAGLNVRSVNVSGLVNGDYFFKLVISASGVTAVKQFMKRP